MVWGPLSTTGNRRWLSPWDGSGHGARRLDSWPRRIVDGPQDLRAATAEPRRASAPVGLRNRRCQQCGIRPNKGRVEGLSADMQQV